jgi:tetratricopeptide (TPR) repeat protein
LLLVVALLSAVAPAHAAPAPKPTPEDIARWIRELGDNDFATREKASRKLWTAGDVAEAAVRQAANSDDPEVKRRASDILEKFRWGIYPDTPKDVLNLIISYQAAMAAPEKINLIGQLIQAGPHGRKALARIAAAEPDEELRAQVFQRISRDLPQLLALGDLDTVQGLVEAGLHSGAMGPSYYAAFWLLRGKLDDRIAFFEKLDADKDEQRQQKNSEILAYLYRAKGDLAAARRAAEKAKRDDLVEALLFEAADWKALARLPELTNTNRAIEKWGYRAAYHRLAGNAKETEDTLAEVRKLVETDPDKETLAFIAAKIFFLNDRPVEALDLLAKSDRPDLRFEVLVARLEYDAAMAMVEEARKTESKYFSKLERLQARTLYFLGEKDKAKAIFARHAAEIKEGIDPERFEDLPDAEYRVGLTDQALEHCARLLALVKANEEPLKTRRLLAQVFPDDTDSAVALWEMLRRAKPDQSPVDAIRQVRALLTGKLPAAEVKELVTKVAEDAKGQTHQPVALAEAALAAGLGDLACSVLEKAGTAPALIRLGDVLAAKKDWAEAARRYHQAWEKEPNEPLALFLEGWALVQDGKKREGEKLMEQSHWVPLADEVVRDAFLQELAKRGRGPALSREADLQRRLSRPESYYYGAALRRVAQEALARKQFLAAATAQEQSILRCLRPGVSFIQASAYVGVPASIHRLRADGYFAAGQVDAARREVALARAAVPANIDLTIQVVPELEKRGLRKEADQMFAETLAIYEKATKEYPRCAWLHNSAAWLSACCRRNLDAALDHAEKAVELAPESPAHLDTLAEVHFQRGEKDKAVALQKKVVEMDRKKTYYQKQLRRLEGGDPKAPRPEEDDD